MYGAILGDMIGAPYEFDRGDKIKDFPLFGMESQFTDDSVMTIAVAEALMESEGLSDSEVRSALAKSMQKWGHRYPNAGYGGMFARWLYEDDPMPYGSYGNGSAMRVSSVGWLYDSLEETRKYARFSAEVTHNHPEGIKGAEAAASAIFLARNGASKDEIREYVVSEFGYDLSRTCDEIRPWYHHVETCQETVPEAITAFLEGNSFEDVIRTAVSLGGDCDTLTCITGGIAEAFYGVPEDLKLECRNRLPDDMLEVLDRFSERIGESGFVDPFLIGNELIEKAIADFHQEESKERMQEVLRAIQERAAEDGHFLVPVEMHDSVNFSFRALQDREGNIWQVAFTSKEEFERGEPSKVLSNFIDTSLTAIFEVDAAGFVINPFGQAFTLTKDMIRRIFPED